MMVLLPTDRSPEAGLEQLLSHLPTTLQVTDRLGHWLRVTGPARQVRLLVHDGHLQYAEPEMHMQPAGLAAPSDPALPNQANYFRLLNLDQTWRHLELGCASPVVAVIDSGMVSNDSGHRWNLVAPMHWFNAVTGQKGNAQTLMPGITHGARVAGVISTVSNDTLPGSGMANNLVKVLPLNVVDSGGTITGTNVARAIEYALGSTTLADGTVVKNDRPADILNLSLAETPGSTTVGAFLASYVERAANQGVIAVVAAGNDDMEVNSGLAASPFVIGVGGVGPGGRRWRQSAGLGSNYGLSVTVAGPAEQVGTYLNGFVELSSGTSLATPWVAGQVGLWMYANQQHHPTRSKTNGRKGKELIDHLRRCLQSTGSSAGVRDAQTGYGVVNTALLVAKTTTACHPTP